MINEYRICSPLPSRFKNKISAYNCRFFYFVCKIIGRLLIVSKLLIYLSAVIVYPILQLCMICNNIHIFRLFSFLSQKFYQVTISLCSLFSIPGNPIYLNSLNETVLKSLLIISICIGLTNRSNSLRISLICSNGTVTNVI